ncbi:hypothetical protein B296_00006424 [Ensete ventricosum]|uniref:Uncharacterized protein n=1 Tax=Ensete ventricosum TaxID=4639 RepID=A0A426Z6Y9_ENSVE|nr:hypothetical protein B296_00006424 [Ensete ventricosum]
MSESQSRRFIPSLAKLIPRAGSGSSGGTSSAGRFTSHESLGWPYRHRFSFSAPPTNPIKNTPGNTKQAGSARRRPRDTHRDRTGRRTRRHLGPTRRHQRGQRKNNNTDISNIIRESEREKEGKGTVGEGADDAGAAAAIVLEDLFDGAGGGRDGADFHDAAGLRSGGVRVRHYGSPEEERAHAENNRSGSVLAIDARKTAPIYLEAEGERGRGNKSPSQQKQLQEEIRHSPDSGVLQLRCSLHFGEITVGGPVESSGQPPQVLVPSIVQYSRRYHRPQVKKERYQH